MRYERRDEEWATISADVAKRRGVPRVGESRVLKRILGTAFSCSTPRSTG